MYRRPPPEFTALRPSFPWLAGICPEPSGCGNGVAMTSANGTPVGNSRRPSAAFPRLARGALPPGPEARAAPASRAFRGILMALALAGPMAAFPGSGGAQPAVSDNAEAGREAGPAAVPAKPSRPAAAHARHRRAAGPRLRDAPQELLPPATEPSGALAARMPASPRAACLAAARRAEEVHGLPEGLLVAVALSESGLHAHALNIGGRAHYPEDAAVARRLLASAPARSSVMAGCVQVNARVHARGADWPLDARRSADWAGGMLRRWYLETGSWVEALRRWHGGSPASTRRLICRIRAKLEVTAPGSGLLQEQPCSPAEIARLRRNGAALLEVAEAVER